MKMMTPNFQSYCLYAAMIVYGCFSSPTPDIIGAPEILIALLLLLSVRIDKSITIDARGIGFLYGISIPILFGILNGHSSGDMTRDIIPFFFFMLPLFLGATAAHNTDNFLKCLAGLGIVFSCRTIFAYQSILFDPNMWGHSAPMDLLYLANSPEVLFSALYCIGRGGEMSFIKGARFKGMIVTLLSVLPVMAMALMAQRAGIGSVILYICLGLGVIFYHHPKRGILLSACVAILIGLLGWGMGPAFITIWQKTEMVGLNARTEEWGAVFDILSKDGLTLLFGEGWGGRIDNPAVGGLNVNFTHSLISSLLLKTGLFGSLVIMAACFSPVIRAIQHIFPLRMNKRDFIMLGAALFPFLISVGLYASYKSLGFGLILLVFFIFPIRKLEKTH